MTNRRYLALLAAALLGLAAVPARAGAPGEPCRIVAPRYEPKAAKSPQADVARWLGGARLSRPVAAPCPPSRKPVDA